MMRLVEVWKGTKRQEMYLYVDQKEGTRRVPDDLLASFGELTSVMVIPMTASRRLARVSATEVLSAIESAGYFLQMPPAPDASAEAQIVAMVEAEEELAKRQQQ